MKSGLVDETNLYIESDSKVVISWVLKHETRPWKYSVLLSDCDELWQRISRVKEVILSHVPRDANSLADFLAKSGISRSSPFEAILQLHFLDIWSLCLYLLLFLEISHPWQKGKCVTYQAGPGEAIVVTQTNATNNALRGRFRCRRSLPLCIYKCSLLMQERMLKQSISIQAAK